MNEVSKPTNTPKLNTRVINEGLTYVQATSRGSALGLFKNLVSQGKSFGVLPGRDNEWFCEFFIEEENEEKRWWRE